MPGIEFPCTKRIVHVEKDLRGGNNDPNLGSARWMQDPHRHGVIWIRPEQPSRSYTRTLYQEREKCGEFVTFGRGRRGERRYGMHALPLSPDSIGIWRHVGNSPVHVPETGIAGRFVQ